MCLNLRKIICVKAQPGIEVEHIMCGNNPPGDNSFDDCRFLTFLIPVPKRMLETLLIQNQGQGSLGDPKILH